MSAISRKNCFGRNSRSVFFRIRDDEESPFRVVAKVWGTELVAVFRRLEDPDKTLSGLVWSGRRSTLRPEPALSREHAPRCTLCRQTERRKGRGRSRATAVRPFSGGHVFWTDRQRTGDRTVSSELPRSGKGVLGVGDEALMEGPLEKDPFLGGSRIGARTVACLHGHRIP